MSDTRTSMVTHTHTHATKYYNIEKKIQKGRQQTCEHCPHVH